MLLHELVRSPSRPEDGRHELHLNSWPQAAAWRLVESSTPPPHHLASSGFALWSGGTAGVPAPAARVTHDYVVFTHLLDTSGTWQPTMQSTCTSDFIHVLLIFSNTLHCYYYTTLVPIVEQDAFLQRSRSWGRLLTTGLPAWSCPGAGESVCKAKVFKTYVYYQRCVLCDKSL